MLRLGYTFSQLFLLVLLVGPIAIVQAQTPTSAMAEAEALFQAQKLGEAEQAYETIIKQDPKAAIAWLRLGRVRHGLGKYDDAIKAFGEALSLTQARNPSGGALAMYGLASAYAVMRNKDKAFEWLDKALSANLQLPEQLINDPDLVSLHDDPRFTALAERARKAGRVCMNNPEYRGFDFLLGDWDVTSVGVQQFTASVSAKVSADGCAVETNWTAGAGALINRYTARTFSFYDPISRKWHQSSVDSGAVSMLMDGEYSEGAMRFHGTAYSPLGKRLIRVTFINVGPDKARHLVETSPGEDKPWTISFDATYTRKK